MLMLPVPLAGQLEPAEALQVQRDAGERWPGRCRSRWRR